jgi:hypothetical protein
MFQPDNPRVATRVTRKQHRPLLAQPQRLVEGRQRQWRQQFNLEREKIKEFLAQGNLNCNRIINQARLISPVCKTYSELSRTFKAIRSLVKGGML